jgi:hypothetical protein
LRYCASRFRKRSHPVKTLAARLPHTDHTSRHLAINRGCSMPRRPNASTPRACSRHCKTGIVSMQQELRKLTHPLRARRHRLRLPATHSIALRQCKQLWQAEHLDKRDRNKSDTCAGRTTVCDTGSHRQFSSPAQFLRHWVLPSSPGTQGTDWAATESITPRTLPECTIIYGPGG